MFEKIYTIPVNEAFDATIEEGSCQCPFCRLYQTLEKNELEIILGASMMEPDIRIQTNQKGFCHPHFEKMLHAKNRLGLALILESHLDEIRKEVSDPLPLGKGNAAVSRVEKLNASCYICDRIESAFSKMLATAAYLHARDSAFRQKLAAQKCICLPHYRALLLAAKKELSKKEFARLQNEAQEVVFGYFDELRGDVKHFCKKFDYRYDQEPWGNAKDAPDRAILFLKGMQEE